jgi:ribosomal protein S18 acetylase RimI-like enzyme
MRLGALASDIRCLVRRDGLGPTLQKVRDGFQGHDLIVVAKRLDEIADFTLDRRLAVSELVEADLPALVDFSRRRCDRRAAERFADRLVQGDRGFVVRQDGKVAGYYWWADREHPHLDHLGIRLADRDVYGFDFFLAEEHRGDGRAVECLHGIETSLRDRGFERVWGYVRSDNRPARWLYSSRGYDTVGKVHLRLGRMR